jgi:hypothetical protein
LALTELAVEQSMGKFQFMSLSEIQGMNECSKPSSPAQLTRLDLCPGVKVFSCDEPSSESYIPIQRQAGTNYDTQFVNL